MKTLLLSLTLAFLISGCGRNPETLNRKGVEALNAGEYSKAARLLEKAAEKTEGVAASEIWGHAGLAAAHVKDRKGDAENFLLKALELDPVNLTVNYNLGDLLIQQNRFDEASGYLEKAAALGSAEALEALAGIALRQGEMESAYSYLQQARALDENVRVLTTLAVAGKGQLSVEESRKLLQKAVTMDPNYAPARLNLAALLDQHRLDPAQAASHYEAFLRIHPDDVKVPLVRDRLQLMIQRQESGDFSRPDPVRREVENLLDQASQAAAQGNKMGALQNCLRANAVATRAQRTDLRERALRAASTLAPDSARAHFGLGQFLLSENRKTEAMVSMEKAREIAPGLQMTLRPSILLAAELGRKEAATTMLQAAEQAGAANADLLLDVGDLYAEALNNERESKRVYKVILDGFPGYDKRTDVQARWDR
ncbi:tetratricopeptide repeat protein [Kiritimatiellaeota bacterium B1221]|nr:tetratricopeptide repeat protein [Kiritimatiellaeota bacterium B1221]